MTKRHKYLFKDRAAAEEAIREYQHQLTMYGIALDALLREEFTFTQRYTTSDGHWFQLGIARALAAHGGIVLVRQFSPINGQPSQRPEWAEGFLHDTAEYLPHLGDYEEARTYRDCFYALRELYWKLQREGT